jgi:hypothetical protein
MGYAGEHRKLVGVEPISMDPGVTFPERPHQRKTAAMTA